MSNEEISSSTMPLSQDEPLLVAIRLGASAEWFSSAHNLMTQVKFIEDMIVDVEYKVRQITTTWDSLKEALEDIKRKTPTYQIVNKSEGSENEEQQQIDEIE